MGNSLVKFKKLHLSAVTPTKAHPTDAGFDITAIAMQWDENQTFLEYSTGIALEIPVGYVGLIFQRSSVSKVSQILSNCVGVIDSGYRGEIKFRFKDFVCGVPQRRYSVGEKIGQLIIMPIPYTELIEVENLSESDRGNGGFGSTGK